MTRPGCLAQTAISLSRQRWLPYKTRRSLIKKLHPAMLRDHAFEADLDGLRFRGNIVNYIDRLVYFCGGHEKYMLHMLRDYARSLPGKPVFADVGANAGNHTLFMSRYADVLAFEPFERVRKQLEENLALNSIKNVRVFPFGLSDKDATLPFYAGPDANLGAASFFNNQKQGNTYLGDLQLKAGDAVLKEAGAGRIDIVKADVEGYEKFVLSGLQATIARDRPLLVVELSEKTRETVGGEKEFFALFPQDYRFYYFARASRDSGAYRLAPFDYARRPKVEDVIACPVEKLTHLPGI
jgi:FkbM family methyltransferase